MIRSMNKRVQALEIGANNASGIWHQWLWRAGQAFADMLAENNADEIDPRDNVILRRIVTPGGDPVHARDEPLYQAWVEARSAPSR